MTLTLNNLNPNPKTAFFNKKDRPRPCVLQTPGSFYYLIGGKNLNIILAVPDEKANVNKESVFNKC